MARERRRAEFAAGARVQRIGEDGDLRTVGEEAVRGSGLESGGGRDSRFSFGAGDGCPCLSSESRASGLRRVGVTPRLRLSPSC